MQFFMSKRLSSRILPTVDPNNHIIPDHASKYTAMTLHFKANAEIQLVTLQCNYIPHHCPTTKHDTDD